MTEGKIALMLRQMADSIDDRITGLPIPSFEPHQKVRGLSLESTVEEYGPYILEAAQSEYNSRQKRSQFIDQSLLGEPAWDILLDGLIHRILGKRITVTSACIASGVPPTTALRWINQLVKNGLLIRTESEADRRRAYVSLSDKTYLEMCRYFLGGSPARGRITPVVAEN